MSSTRRNRFWMSGAIIISLLLFVVLNTALLIALHKDRLRRARLYEPKDIVVGIDVSHYQGVIDWDRVKNTQIRFVESDLFENIKTQKFDIIVSNPPYVSYSEMAHLGDEVKQEPFQALYGGKDGLEIISRLLEKSADYLNTDGVVLLEIGCSQGQAVKEICNRNGFRSICVFQDYSGLDRIIQAESHG